MKQDNADSRMVNQTAWILNYQPTIGEQHIHMGEQQAQAVQEEKTEDEAYTWKWERNEELFHFVHPELDEAEAWRIHDAVRRVVRLQGIQMICQYLVEAKDRGEAVWLTIK